MCRVAWGALVALGLASAAAAQDFDGAPWMRTELPSGDIVWIASEDIAGGGSGEVGGAWVAHAVAARSIRERSGARRMRTPGDQSEAR